MEIAGGIRWVKEHPVVSTAAAAVATAVSVLTYLKAKADEEHAQQHAVVSDEEREHATTSDKTSAWSSNSAYDLFAMKPNSSDASSTRHLRSVNTDEVEEVCSITESDASTATSPFRRASPTSASVSAYRLSECHCELPADVFECTQCYDFDAEYGATLGPTELSAANKLSSATAEDEDDPTTSPQWGWYVSTTPPEEYYS